MIGVRTTGPLTAHRVAVRSASALLATAHGPELTAHTGRGTR